jgi:hypothetical protein
MKLTRLVISVVVLAIVAIVAWRWSHRTTPHQITADPRVGQPLAAPASFEGVGRITLSRDAAPLELVRDPAGIWRLPALDNVPADFGRLSRLVRDLQEATVVRQVTANPERIARMGFPAASVVAADSAGTVRFGVQFAQTMPDGGGAFFRFVDEATAYLLERNLWIDTALESWADRTVIDGDPDQVMEFQLTLNPGSPAPDFHVRRTAPGEPWQLVAPVGGQSVNSERLDRWLGSLVRLRHNSTVPIASAAAAEARGFARSYRWALFSGEQFTLDMGRRPERVTAADPEPAASLASGADATGDQGPAPAPVTQPAGPVHVFYALPFTQQAWAPITVERAFLVSDFHYTQQPALDELLVP